MTYDVEHLKSQTQLFFPSMLSNTPPPFVFFSVLGTKPMERDRQILFHGVQGHSIFIKHSALY